MFQVKNLPDHATSMNLKQDKAARQSQCLKKNNHLQYVVIMIIFIFLVVIVERIKQLRKHVLGST